LSLRRPVWVKLGKSQIEDNIHFAHESRHWVWSTAFISVGALVRADPVPTIHYAPAENLEHIDVELIDSTKHEIRFVAYVLTD